MLPHQALATVLPLCSACMLGDDSGPAPVPPGCVDSTTRETATVNVSGTIRDFTTLQPVAGATIDLTTAWDVTSNLPAAACPLLGSVTSDEAGRFGLVAIAAGSSQQPPIVLFMVRGGGRAPTLSDNRTCTAATCDLGHDIAAPSAALAASWRADLAAGGMADAAHHGLIAFLYKEADGAPAEGVEPLASVDPIVVRPGLDVRFVGPDRGALLPATQATTSSSSVALLGVANPTTATDHEIDVAGRRGMDTWSATGTLVADDFIFVEDRTMQPPP